LVPKHLGVVEGWKIRSVISTPVALPGNDAATHIGIIYADWKMTIAQVLSARQNYCDLWFKWRGDWLWIDCGWMNKMHLAPPRA